MLHGFCSLCESVVSVLDYLLNTVTSVLCEFLPVICVIVIFCTNYSDFVFAVRDRARKRGGSANWRGKGWRRKRE
jgi:hypothetical protein